MKVDEFVRRLKTLIDEHEDSKFVFFLGAGCSISSGIPSATSLVRSWLLKLKKMKTGSNDNFTSWLTETFPEYTEETASLFYGKVIEELFLLPEQRQREVERLTEGKDPGFGYAVLAQLMTHLSCGSHCNVVLTVNFDDLIADALYLYTQKKPLVISHEFLAGFVRVTRTRPLVIKLHGDARLEPKNTEEETEILPEAVRKVLKNILYEMGIIFIGYRGNDQSIAEILEELPPHSVPWGIYWIGSKIPEGKIGEWLVERNAVWIKQNDFDELMLLLLDEFELGHPEKDRFDKLYNTYFETFKKLKERIDAQPEEEVKSSKIALEKAMKDFGSWSAVILEAEKYEKEDPEKAVSIYREGLKKFPDNVNLLGSYANFLYEIRNNYDTAEEYYKKILELNPEHARAHNNYAVLLWVMKRFEEAESHYKEALRINPEYANAHYNYAILLGDMKKTEEAESHYMEALRINPEYVNAHYNYANLLKNMKRFEEAESHYQEALRINPDLTLAHYNYANLLKNMKRFEEAESHYQEALRINPEDVNIVGNYAGLLLARGNKKGFSFLQKAIKKIRKDQSKKTMLLEFLFYQYAHSKDKTIQKKSLKEIKSLLQEGITSPGWDLSHNVDRARKDKHPHIDFLEKLSKVISEEIDMQELENFKVWQEI